MAISKGALFYLREDTRVVQGDEKVPKNISIVTAVQVKIHK